MVVSLNRSRSMFSSVSMPSERMPADVGGCDDRDRPVRLR